MKTFKLVKAASAESAISVLRDGQNARVLAGGTDILGTLHNQIHENYPETLISLKNAGLSFIRKTEDAIEIGAMTKLSEIETDPEIIKSYSLLSEAAKTVASPQIRHMATLGGNICQEPRCWYYRYPDNKFSCIRKGGASCNAFTGNNLYHSIFGASRICDTPCEQGCPNGTAISDYLRKIREGDIDGAAREMLRVNPIPSITGRVCPHHCQNDCNRNEYDESVSIRNVERFLGDYILKNQSALIPKLSVETGKSIAVIGSGPAGLTAAYYLRQAGHQVTVFDRNPLAGGMLTYAIPAYRLPKDVVEQVVDMLKNIGVRFVLGSDVDPRDSLREYRKRFDSVFLACGAWGTNTIGLDGESYAVSGLDFLYSTNCGKLDIPGDNVIVIGGGNVAIDAAITAKHLGSKKVTIIYRRTRNEMPADLSEIEQALEEGVELMTSLAPSRILTDNGIVTGIEVMKSMSPGSRNDATFVDPASAQIIGTDCVITAVGQKIDAALFSGIVETKKNDRIIVEEDRFETSLTGVFAGGDVVSGPATVVEAIAAARKAAGAMDEYLTGRKNIPDRKEDTDCSKSAENYDRTFDLSCLLKSKAGAAETIEAAVSEAKRCFNCGCVASSPSDLAPALIALNAEIITSDRMIDAVDFFEAGIDRSTVLEKDEIVLKIRIPRSGAFGYQKYLKFRARKSIDFPVASVAVALELEGDIIKEARIVLGAVKPVPFNVKDCADFLKGKRLELSMAEEAAEIAMKTAVPLAENAYKIKITKTLVKRAILGAVES